MGQALSARLHGCTLAAMPNYRMMIVLLLALAAPPPHGVAFQINSRETVLIEYLIVGTVVWVHTGPSSSIGVRGSGLLGHLRVSVKSYKVKQSNALLTLQPGDAITAVFSRKDGMLHRVRRVRRSAGDTH
jgi:hypothetical protein